MNKLYYSFVFFGRLFFVIFCLSFVLTIFFKIDFLKHEWILPNNTTHFIADVKDEKYNSNLSFLNSMQKLENFFLNEIEERNLNNLEAIYFADELLRDRFYHKDTVISIKDNWFLYVFNFFSKNRNNSLYISSVDPNYILKSDHALCNQQALIFQKLMETINVDYQSILFNVPRSPVSFGHFASAARIDESWFFIDTNLEPPYQQNDATILPRLLDGDLELFNLLYSEFSADNLPPGAISTSSLNKNPAFMGNLLQKITYFISNYMWVSSLFSSFFFRFLSRRIYKII